MSIIGAKVQSQPLRRALSAVISAVRRQRSGSHAQLCASGIGVVTVQPWIMSCPKITGMPRRDSSAAFWTSARFSRPGAPMSEPTLPWRTRSRTSSEKRFFVLSADSTPFWNEGRNCPSCPIFSSSVMRETRSETRASTGLDASLYSGTSAKAGSAARITAAANVFVIVLPSKSQSPSTRKLRWYSPLPIMSSPCGRAPQLLSPPTPI